MTDVDLAKTPGQYLPPATGTVHSLDTWRPTVKSSRKPLNLNDLNMSFIHLLSLILDLMKLTELLFPCIGAELRVEM